MVEQELDPKLAWMESKKNKENRGVSTSTPIMPRKTDLTSPGLICYAIDFIMNFFLHITIKCLIFKKYMKKGYCF